MWTSISDLEPLSAPQERFDALSAATFRRFGRHVVDLSYANPYDGPDDEVRRALQLAIADDKGLALQYTPYGGKTVTRRLIASRLSQDSGLPFNFRDVVMTPGATAALNVTFRALFGPDDELLVLTPCWLDYPLYLQNLGIPLRFVELRDDKHLDLSAIGHGLSRRSRGLLLSHPCCPTGVVYSREELEGLAALLAAAEERFDTRIHLISDEVHRQLIWRPVEFHSPLSSYPRSLSIYSFGKALSLQGQRIGYVAVSPRMPEREAMRRQLERCVRIMGFGAPTTLMQQAICRLLDYQPPLDMLASRQEAVRRELKAAGYEVCDAPATFFVYVKSPLADDFTFAERLAAHGVLVLPSTLFHESGYFRISVTASWDSLVAGLPVFRRVREGLDPDA